MTIEGFFDLNIDKFLEHWGSRRGRARANRQLSGQSAGHRAKKAVLLGKLPPNCRQVLMIGISLLLFCQTIANARDISWTYQSGGSPAKGMAIDSAGRIYVIGTNVLYRFNNGGNLTGTGSLSGNPSGVAVDSLGNIYLVGSVCSSSYPYYCDIWVQKIDANGFVQWTRSYDSPNGGDDYGYAIAADASGNVVITGSAGFAFYDPDSYIVVQKLDTTGSVLWTKTFNPTTLDDSGRGVGIDSAGNVYVIGTSNYILSDLVLIKYDSTGGLLWSQINNIGGGLDTSDSGNGLSINGLNGVFVIGAADNNSQEDIWVGKYNASGAIQWSASHNSPGGNYHDVGYAIASDSFGNAYAVGYEGRGDIGQGTNVWVRKYDGNGTIKWTETYNSPSSQDDWAQAVALDSSGNIFVAGSSAGGLWVRAYTQRPKTPTGFAVSNRTTTSLTWGWTDASDDEDGFYLFTGNGGVAASLSPNITSAQETGLSPNTAYVRGVSAYNSYGASSTPVITAYTLATVPTNPRINSSESDTAVVEWDANGNPAGTRYVIQSSIDPGFQNAREDSTVATSIRLADLVLDATNYIRIRAENGDRIATSYTSVLAVQTPKTNLESVGGAGGTLVTRFSTRDLRLEVPAGAFKHDVVVSIGIPASFPSVSAPAANLNGMGVGFEITLDKDVQPSGEVVISIGYQDTDVAGFDESKLAICRLDTTRNVWVPLVSTPDPSGNRVTARTNHFSTFQVMGISPANALSAAKVFPNPFRPSQGHAAITFSNFPSATKLQIYTLSGELVREITTNSAGMASWDTTNRAGARVASGVYFVLGRASGAGNKVFKLAIQR